MPIADLQSLSGMGLAMNPPYLGEWPTKVGQYMLNFGAIELISFQHLALLETNRKDFDKNLDRLLSHRIDRINTLVNRAAALSDTVKAEVKSLWSDVRELAKWRNRIAHNPALPTWHAGSDSERSPPDLLGVPDMKQLKISNVTDSISLDGMDRLINVSASLGQRLHEATAKLRAEA